MRRRRVASAARSRPPAANAPASNAAAPDPDAQRARRAARRRSHALVMSDQAVSSITNMIATIVIAHTLPAADLGKFALAFSTYWIFLGFSRAYIQEPMLITIPLLGSGEVRGYATRAYGAALGLGAVGGVAGVVFALFVPSLRAAFLPIGILMPLLLVQDVVRYHDFARKKSTRAIISDSVWLMLFLAIAPFCHTLWSATLTWALTGAVSAFAGEFGPMLASARTFGQFRWFVEHRDSGGFFALEFVTVQLVLQASIWFVAGFGSLAQAGAYRTGQTIIMPLKRFSGALIVSLLPRMTSKSADAVRRGSVLYAELSFGVCAVGAIAIMLCPDALGRLVFGHIWYAGQPIGALLAAATAVSSLSQACMLVLKSTRNFRRSLFVRIACTPVTVTAVLLGALWDAGQGAALGLLIGNALSAFWWWRAARRTLADAAPQAADSSAGRDLADTTTELSLDG